MTHIVSGIKTKRELAERLAQGKHIFFEDHNLFANKSLHSTQFKPDQAIVCKPPDGRWIAYVRRTLDGKWRVT